MPKDNQRYKAKGLYIEYKSALANRDVTNTKEPLDPMTDVAGILRKPYLHAYLVYRDGKGGERVFRGGPDLNPVEGAFGDIAIEDLPLDQSKDEYIADNNMRDRLVIKLPIPDEDLEKAVHTLSKTIEHIGDAGVDYDLVGTPQTSNSVVAAGLRSIGLDMRDHLPDGVNPSQLPGMDNDLEEYLGTRNRELSLTEPEKTFVDADIEKLGAELTAPGDDVDEALLKPDLTDDELSGLMRSNAYLNVADPRHRAVQDKAKTWFEARDGRETAKPDAAGRLIVAAESKKPAPKFPTIATEQPTGGPLDDAVGRVAQSIMGRAREISAPEAVRTLQHTLNDQDNPVFRPTPMLKTDGIAGPKTRRALRFATAHMGADNVLSRYRGEFARRA